MHFSFLLFLSLTSRIQANSKYIKDCTTFHGIIEGVKYVSFCNTAVFYSCNLLIPVTIPIQKMRRSIELGDSFIKDQNKPSETYFLSMVSSEERRIFNCSCLLPIMFFIFCLRESHSLSDNGLRSLTVRSCAMQTGELHLESDDGLLFLERGELQLESPFLLELVLQL